MREGWEPDDKMMIISAGLDPDKPDHQHGDMLGIQAIANGHAILPNYQVRYSLKDFDLFKNSMVKNVALVDDQLQGKQWRSNKGGSGFGKFGQLPSPEVIAWKSNENHDFFAGTHDGFEDVGVNYSRQVIYVKNDFWIVKDNFSSDKTHEYKQVWQGHYTLEKGPDLIRSTTQSASGHDILQLSSTDSVFSSGKRGKQWSVVSKQGQEDFSFVSIIYPYQGYNNRLDETAEHLSIGDWKVNQLDWEIVGKGLVSLSSDTGGYFFSIESLKNDDFSLSSESPADLYISLDDGELLIHSLSVENLSLTMRFNRKREETKILEPGEIWTLKK